MVTPVAAPRDALEGTVRLIVQPPTAQIVIDNPGRRNALTLAMMGQLTDAVAQLEQHDDLVACIVRGTDVDFCAGADQYEVASRLDGDFGARLTREMGATLDCLERLPLVTIAAVDGVALGGGLEVALACSVRLAAADARLGMVQIANGLSAAWGGATRLCELIGPGRATLLATTGRVLDGAEARTAGLVDEVVPPTARVADVAAQLADEVGRRPADAVRAIVGDVAEWRRSVRSHDALIRERDTFHSLWGSSAHREATARWRGR